MVLPNEATKTIINKFPDLEKSKCWKSFWPEEYDNEKKPLRLYRMMSILACYIKSMLNENYLILEKQEEIEEIFNLMELFLNEGDKDVKCAVSTCFLENLVNYISWGTLKPETFLCYLGPKSKAYCKAWDEFTGVKTEDLWD